MTKQRICAAVAVVLSFGVASCNQNKTEPAPIRPVLTMALSRDPATAGGIVGSVQPQVKTDLSFRTVGRLIARPSNVGDTVGRGDVVAAIDSVRLEMAIRAAAADVASSQAELTNKAAAENRQRTLVASSAATQSTLETAEQAKAAAQASLARAQANMAKAREQLGYAQLRAEFDGVVTAVGAEVGQTVSPGQIVVTIARPDIREAVIDVSEEIASSLQTGAPLGASLQLDPSIRAEGKIREIAPQADPLTRMRRVRITLLDPPEAFRLGSTVETRIAEGGSTLRAPNSAILAKDGKTFVWVVDPDSEAATPREVVGVADAHGFRIVSGVDAGARIVTAGVNTLVEGQKVRIDKDDRP